MFFFCIFVLYFVYSVLFCIVFVLFLYCLVYCFSLCAVSFLFFTSLPTTATGWKPIAVNKYHFMSYISWNAFWNVQVVSVHTWEEQRCQLCLWNKCTATVQNPVVRAVIGRCYVTWPWPSTVKKDTTKFRCKSVSKDKVIPRSFETGRFLRWYFIYELLQYSFWDEAMILHRQNPCHNFYAPCIMLTNDYNNQRRHLKQLKIILKIQNS